MSPVGIATIALGAACLALGPSFSLTALVVASLFQAAAAVTLGGAQATPGHALLAFVVPAILFRRREGGTAMRALAFPDDAFFLLCVVCYGIATAYFMPRLLAGMTMVNPIGGAAVMDSGGALVPLAPVSGNVTQSVYSLSDIVCFLTALAACRSGRGHVVLARAFMAYAAVDIAFALMDLATYLTGTGWLMDPIRNAQYTFHLEEESGGLKRIAGTFSEASSFASATLGAFGFTAAMWLRQRWTAASGALALATLALLAASTSSTALAGLAATVCVLYALAVRTATTRGTRNALAATLAVPPIAVAVAAAVALSPAATATVTDFLNTVIFDKSTSDSGMARSAMNHAAYANFLDTAGVGTGLGSNRASSWALAVLSNVGIVGAMLFAAFLWCVLARPRAGAGTFGGDVTVAARVGVTGMLAASVVSGTIVEMGLAFYAMAAMACALPALDGPARTRSRAAPGLLGSAA